MASYTSPRKDAVEAFMKTAPDDRPIIVVSLLRFRTEANYGGKYRDQPTSGREAFRLYQELALPLMREVGGEMLMVGPVYGALIAPEGENWDSMTISRFPTKKALVQLVANPNFAKALMHRMASLEDSRLIAMTAEQGNFTSF